MALEKQFASFLLDRIDENVKGLQGEAAQQIRLHLKELRAVVESSLGSTRGRKSGGGDA